MKIAVPVTKEGSIDNHFGHCEFYKIYTVNDGNQIVETQILESEKGCGCKSNIASTLASQGVSVMLAGGIGTGAINVLNNAGINVIRGCSGDATEIIRQYVSGSIADSGSTCQHHDQEGEHVCSH